jgi:hypothetical protein
MAIFYYLYPVKNLRGEAGWVGCENKIATTLESIFLIDFGLDFATELP